MGRDARALLALLATAALLISAPRTADASASHGNNGRRLHQATAVAQSRAEAAPGGTAVSNVNAGAVSTGGQPATAVAQGASVAAAGQVVKSECNVFAENTEQYKTCIGTPEGSKQNTTANVTAAAAAGVVSWESAKTCSSSSNVTNSTPDGQGRLWGYENGASCAFKTANGSAVYAPSGAAAGGGGGGGASGGSGGGSATAAGATGSGSGSGSGGSGGGGGGGSGTASGGGGGGSTANAVSNAAAKSDGGPASASASANAVAYGRRRRQLMANRPVVSTNQRRV